MEIGVKHVIFTVFGAFLASYHGLVPPARGTFRCDDPSLQHKYQGDTVPTKILILFILVPIILIVSI